MEKSTIKTIGLSLFTFVIIGLGLSLTSTTTVENSNTQLIKELAGELHAVHGELAELKATKDENMASMTPFIGEVIMFAGNFAPRGWALCDGQLLPIAQYNALFSLLGTTYGGDGRTTFALPDLRGRAPIHAGSGYGLSTRTLGQKLGSEIHNLTTNELPPHSHNIVADLPTHNFVESGEELMPGNAALLGVQNPINGTVHEEFNTTFSGGNGQSFNIMQPSLVVNYIIALDGTYPSRQ